MSENSNSNVAVQLADLVQDDAPTVDDWRQHTSEWDEYKDEDFPLPKISLSRNAVKASFQGGLILVVTGLTYFLVEELALPYFVESFVGASPTLDMILKFAIFAFSTGWALRTYIQRGNPQDETETSEGQRIKLLWPGSGQLQFGCGPKGISVISGNRFTYLLHWQKISDIYDESDPFSPEQSVRDRLNQFYFVTDSFPDSLASLYLETMSAEKQVTSGTNGDAIRIRLHKSSSLQADIEELVVPKRFFSESNDSESWQTFLDYCKAYKVVDKQFQL